MNANEIKKVALATIALAGTPLFAHQGDSASARNVSTSEERVMTREELVALGYSINGFKNAYGQIRALYPNELVKVRIHEESGNIDFSSFDNYNRVLAHTGNTPRNIW